VKTRARVAAGMFAVSLIVITEGYNIGDSTFSWAASNSVGFAYFAWTDRSGGVLTSARTHTPNALGMLLKESYCSLPSVNSLSKC
jgi:hypothetical protein